MPEKTALDKKPPHLLWWSIGCVMLNFAINETVNKYGSSWPDWVIVLLWILPLIPFGIWAFIRERSLLNRRWLISKFKNHPISLILIIAFFLFVVADQTARIVAHFHAVQHSASVQSSSEPSLTPPTTVAPQPTSGTLHPPIPAKQQIPPQQHATSQASTNKPRHRKTAPKTIAVTQDGVNNQQTATQAPIEQNNSGGCNQQVVGGNNNTNNCTPPERQLTEAQETGLAQLVDALPKEFMVVVGSGDSGEPERYAAQIHQVFVDHGTTRQPGILYGWHPKGIFITYHSDTEPCAPYAIQLANGMQKLGFAISAVGADSRVHEGEIHLLVGDQ